MVSFYLNLALLSYDSFLLTLVLSLYSLYNRLLLSDDWHLFYLFTKLHLIVIDSDTIFLAPSFAYENEPRLSFTITNLASS